MLLLYHVIYMISYDMIEMGRVFAEQFSRKADRDKRSVLVQRACIDTTYGGVRCGTVRCGCCRVSPKSFWFIVLYIIAGTRILLYYTSFGGMIRLLRLLMQHLIYMLLVAGDTRFVSAHQQLKLDPHLHLPPSVKYKYTHGIISYYHTIRAERQIILDYY